MLASLVTFEICAREQWRTQSTWRTGEHGILASWVAFEVSTGEQWIIQSTQRTGE